PKERQRRADKHAAWLKNQQANNLHDARVELVRKYLANPNQWPDGLDWPNWKQPHEIWYTGNEEYWNARARQKQAELDSQALPKAVAKALVDTFMDTKPVSTVTSSVDTTPVHIPVHTTVHIKPVDTRVDSVDTTTVSTVDTAADRRRAYKREWMRQHRA